MPKSKNRKNHSQKVSAYKIKMENQKKALQKMNREFYEKLQKEQFEKMTADGAVENVVDAEGLDLDLDLGLNDDMGLEDISNPLVEEVSGNTEEVEYYQPVDMFEGVTSPDQLKK